MKRKISTLTVVAPKSLRPKKIYLSGSKKNWALCLEFNIEDVEPAGRCWARLVQAGETYSSNTLAQAGRCGARLVPAGTLFVTNDNGQALNITKGLQESILLDGLDSLLKIDDI